MSGLTELLARCEAATGPDREIDAAIAATFRIHWTSADHWINRSPEVEFRPMAPGGWRDGWLEIWMPGETSPRDKWKALEYTASIDAISALIEKVLPDHYGYGWHKSSYMPETGPQPTRIAAEIWHVAGGHTSFTTGQTDKSPALGLCIALLRALISRTPATGGKP